jgi:MFS transporter, ACS family, tartrate transporter
MALFATGSVIAGIIGSPLSGSILGLHGAAGLEGWQWLFLLEAIPAVLMGFVILFVLPKGPDKARWLSRGEKDWIKQRLEEETSLHKEQIHFRLSKALLSGRVWLLCLIYFLLNVGGYGYEMWLPSIISGFSGMSFSTLGLINSIPYIAAAISMFLVGYNSDRTGDRRIHIAIAATLSAVGFFFSARLHNPFLAMTALTVAFVGLKSTMGPFWAFGTTFLSGTAAAGGIAFINSVGNLGGFVGPTLVGVVKDKTGNNELAFWLLGGALLLMGILILAVRGNSIKWKEVKLK